MLNEQIGQYRITGRLGQGGMGEILAARDEKLNRTVAVKFIANAKMDSDASREHYSDVFENLRKTIWSA